MVFSRWMMVAMVGAAWVGVGAMHIAVAPHQDECFYEYVDAGNKLKGSFEVIAGGLLDIDVLVFGPHGEAHYSVQRQKTGAFTVMAQVSGLYRTCFSNRMSTLTEKTVAFSLHTGDQLYQDIAKQESISPLEREITTLADAINVIEDEQKYMWARERAARDTNESTNSRVVWFSLLELVAMLGIGLWQVYAISTFFERRGKV